MDYAIERRADALAAQYVAGTLRGPARRRFEALLPGHPALRRAMVEWQERLLPLTEVLPPVSPPATVWQRIERTLWSTAPAGSTALSGSTAPSSARAAAGWWDRLGLWRALSAVALAAVVGLAVLVAQPPPSLPPVVIVLQGTGADATTAAGAGAAGAIVASVSGDGRALVTRPLTPVSLAENRVLELWSVPPQGSGAPRSLGLISASGVTALPGDRVPQALLAGGTDALAVSVEPPGGSPTGGPTGPVVFAGKIAR